MIRVHAFRTAKPFGKERFVTFVRDGREVAATKQTFVANLVVTMTCQTADRVEELASCFGVVKRFVVRCLRFFTAVERIEPRD